MTRFGFRVAHMLDDHFVLPSSLHWSRPLSIGELMETWVSVATGVGHIFRPWGGARLEAISKLEWKRP